jgi:Resolvase, N terminal domain
MSAIVATLSKQSAIKAIKEEIRAKGGKVSELSRACIEAPADAYAAAHRDELAAEARIKITTSSELLKMYEKEQREFAKISNSAQSKEHCSNSEILERNSGAKVGYARVSTDGQTLDAQQAALREAGCGRVFAEKESGAKTDRVQLAQAIASLRPGDTLIVTKLDRLARSTRDLLNTLDAIGKAGAAFKSLGDGWADTTTPAGKLMVTVLGGLAEYERHLILARTTEGRTRAKARGIRFGRHPKLTPSPRARRSRASWR